MDGGGGVGLGADQGAEQRRQGVALARGDVVGLGRGEGDALRADAEKPVEPGFLGAQRGGDGGERVRGVLEGGLPGMQGAQHVHQHGLPAEAAEVGLEEVLALVREVGVEALAQQIGQAAALGGGQREEPEDRRLAARPGIEGAAGLEQAHAEVVAAGAERVAVEGEAPPGQRLLGRRGGGQRVGEGQERARRRRRAVRGGGVSSVAADHSA